MKDRASALQIADISSKHFCPHPVMENTQLLLQGELSVYLVTLPQHAGLNAEQWTDKRSVHDCLVLANVSQGPFVEVPEVMNAAAVEI